MTPLLLAILALSPVSYDHALSAEQSVVWAESPVLPRVALVEAPVEPELTLQEQIRAGDTSTSTLRLFIEETISTTSVKNLVFEIIKRESGWGWDVCNQKFGCNAGQGLMQIIPSTELICEKHFNRAMNMINPVDNVNCGIWLLGDGSGISHWDDMSWKQGKPKKWGSGPYYLENFTAKSI